ncbi:MAG TPA: helix-turn-helix domain-containing protein [Nocardioidaceae bacterium]|nr:helix-turn-helix domain-containing protein [Nocardioidaceae bacterium]
MTESVKRTYRSEARQAAAAETRIRVLDAAAELFVTRGYEGTTLKEVAERAGVGARTVYDKFGDKLELYKQTVKYRTRGDDEPIPHPERPASRAVYEATDPHEILRLHVEYGANLMERAAELIMVSATAAAIERELAENFGRAVSSVHAIHLKTAKHLQALGHLKPDMDPVTAADIMHALSTPQTFIVLRRHRRWSLARYKSWATETFEQQLLKSE